MLELSKARPGGVGRGREAEGLGPQNAILPMREGRFFFFLGGGGFHIYIYIYIWEELLYLN